MQTAQNLVGFLYGQYTLSFQYVVEMGLGYSGKARQSALSGNTATHPPAKLVEEALLQIVERHWLT